MRGAPAIGATGAYGVALAAARARSESQVRRDAARLRTARPTAVNLARGVDRVLAAYEAGGPEQALTEAHALAAEDVAANRALGAHGASLVPDGARILTHCNAGALACVGYGTALGIVRAAAEAGNDVRVWVDETRPVLQGARLTAWELGRLGIAHAVVADVAAGSLMARGEVDLVVVGADRVAANGDVANKVGTYPLAVLARHHGIPFVVAAPTTTLDLATADGGAITVEERASAEVTHLGGVRTVPRGHDRTEPGVRRHPGGTRERDRHGARGGAGPVRAHPAAARPPLIRLHWCCHTRAVRSGDVDASWSLPCCRCDAPAVV